MPKRLRAWIASPAETRATWIIASICIAVTIGFLLWPLAKSDSSNIQLATQADTVTTVLKQPKPLHHTAQPKKIKKSAERLKPASPPLPKSTLEKQPHKSVVSATLASGYYVQLGAFKDDQRAESLSKKLGSAWQTHIASRPNGMIAVWVGPYKTSKEATRFRDKLLLSTKLKGFVVKQ